jgi:hypothetical protein
MLKSKEVAPRKPILAAVKNIIGTAEEEVSEETHLRYNYVKFII